MEEEDHGLEKSISLNIEEATALLEMSLFTYLKDFGEAAHSALTKLGNLCREFSAAQESQAELAPLEPAIR